MLRAFGKDAVTMKIESSAVRMDSTYSATKVSISANTYTQTFGVATLLPDAKTGSTAEENNGDKKSLTLSVPMRQSVVSSSNKIRSSTESYRSLNQRLFRYIIEQMREMLSGNNFLSQSKTEHLTSDSSSLSGTQIWYREQQQSYHYYAETEATTFSTTGIVKTSDGREIDFSVHLSLSRAFMEETQLETTLDDILTFYDPLVINMDVPSATVTNQHFLFDIDSNGTSEEIASLSRGSGFLSLDKNEDGKINDGSELFGAKTGDGFSELAAYDKDGNGWIDENDTVFNKLKVWTKDQDGNDCLLSLKEADVGAIFLGNVSTGFNLNNSDNDTLARIQSTGIYLHESTGEAGTIQHVDFSA